MGHRSGVVCNSDGHKGRPGASYPGVTTFGAYGGLTCFLTDTNTRDGIFECLRRRHHYGTTGCRLHLQVHAEFEQEATLYERDPNIESGAMQQRVRKVMMGDIVKTTDQQCRLSVEVHSPSPIERIEIRNGTEVLEVIRPYAEQS